MDSIKKIIVLFLVWRTALFAVAALAAIIITEFGARFPYYQELLISTGLPSWIWGFGNFDGVHYLTIAQKGYVADFTQSFFPLYPMLIKILSINNLYFITGFMISNLLFLASMIILYKLFNMDFTKDISLKAVIFLIIFPTSFYFGSVYSESLFIFLAIMSMYFARKQNYIVAGIFACLASATRVIGIFLLPFLLIEIYLHHKGGLLKHTRVLASCIIGILISPLGLISYMLYLNNTLGDPLYFLNALPNFGTGRSNEPFILLPQVLFRYLKILTSVDIYSLAFFNASMELIFTAIPLLFLIIFFKKIRFSYWIFVFSSLILPTLTGTLTSMPRYALVTFLIFPLMVQFVAKYEKPIFFFLIILQVILVSLFIRGYWVA